MSIRYEPTSKIISLETDNTTYKIQIGRFGHILHLYYGASVTDDMEHVLTYADRGFSGNPYEASVDRTYSLDALPQEYPTDGTGDYRLSCLTIKNHDGTYSTDLRYIKHRILKGKYSIPGLPALYGGSPNIHTLELNLMDAVSQTEVTLYYGVFEKTDIITRSLKITNGSNDIITLEKVMSSCVDLHYGDYEWYSFHGRHAMERTLQKAPVQHGIQGIGSKRGTSSHQYNPLMVITEKGCHDTQGNCYGMNFVYSGGFKAEIEKDQYSQTRVVMGLQDELFSYELSPKQSFWGPEVVMSFSATGTETLTHNFHNIYRSSLLRGPKKDHPSSILLNTWEAVYFDFNEKDILEIADQARKLGVEMIVLDDGWFGNRNNDFCGLGDWFVNEDKLNGGLGDLITAVNDMGLKFGLWFEPEMINEDSDLYRNHPDWALSIPGRKPIRGRSQLVLDYSRAEVVQYIYDRLCHILDSGNIEYIKWDFNRSISDVYSYHAPNGQGGVMYDYMLGLYDLLERIIERYPELLIEGCSGGGGRFDPGMLYYTPQIWASDNTDTVDRISILEGTAFAYPVSTIGSHVSAVPNHQTGRTIDMNTRAIVAYSGTFGYELDLNKITDDEKDDVINQIKLFKQYRHIIHQGDYYRLKSIHENQDYAAWQFSTKNKDESLVSIVTLSAHGNPLTSYIRLKGLNPSMLYQLVGTDEQYHGDTLMNAGLPLPKVVDDYQGIQLHLRCI